MGWKRTIRIFKNTALVGALSMGLGACQEEEAFEESARPAVEEEADDDVRLLAPEREAEIEEIEVVEPQQEEYAEDTDLPEEEREEGVLGSMDIPPETQALRVSWKGDPQVRVGQRYSYELEVANVSGSVLRNVTVYQSLPEDFEIVSSEPSMASADGRQGGSQGPQSASQGQQSATQGQQSGTQERQSRSQERQSATQEQQSGTQERQSGTQEQRSRTQEQQSGSQEQQSTPGQQSGFQGQTTPAGVQTAVWRLGSLEAEETRPIEVTAVVHGTDNIRPCVYADYQAGICPEIQVVEPELTMTMEYLDADDNPKSEFYACDEIFVAYRLRNTGTGRTRPVTVVQALPRGIQTADGNNQVELELEGIPAGETVVTEPIALQVENTGTFQTSARANAGEAEANAKSVPLTVMRPRIALSVDGPDREFTGQSLTYQVEVTNNSEYPAVDTRVQVPIIEDLERVSLSTQRFEREDDVLRLGPLGANESVSFTIRAEAAEPGTLSSRVVAEAYCAAEASRTVSTNIVGIPAVQIEMTDDTDPVPVGELVRYDITVWNEGTAEDLNVQLSGSVPSGMSFVEVVGATDVTMQQGSLQFEPVSELAPGDEASWEVVMRVNNEGRKRFQIEMSSDATRRPVRETEPTRAYQSESR